jgi:hypothetical protein
MNLVRMLGLRRVLLLGALAATVAAFAPGLAASAPTNVTMTLTGYTPVDDTLVHYGTFTASPPLCPSGTWVMDGIMHHTFTCADGSGTFPARFAGDPWERSGGSASWQIAAPGTGRYANLRGLGTANVVIVQTGDPIKFQATWQGTVDFDATAPTVSTFSGRVTRAAGSRTLKIVHLRFVPQDLPAANPVGYQLLVFAGTQQLGRMRTGTASGATSLSFGVSVAAGTHSLRISLALTDPVGNTSDFNLRLPVHG